MEKQYYSQSYIVAGILLIMFGLGTVFFKQAVLQLFTIFLALMLVSFSLLHLVRVLFLNRRKQNQKDILSEAIEVCISLFLAYYVYRNPTLPVNILANILGIYLLLIGIISIISTILLLKDNSPARYWRGFYGLMHIVLGILAFQFSIEETRILNVIGLYFIILGITYISDGWGAVFFDQTGETFRRHMRFSIPIVFHAHLPRKLLEKLKEYLTVNVDNLDESNLLSTEDEVEDKVLNVMFSTSPENIDLLGHINIGYQGYIYNYGNYDVDSRRLFDSVGDGVLAVIEKEKFIDFNLNRGQTMVEYDIPLNKKQQVRIEEAMSKLLSGVVEFHPTTNSQWQSHGGQLKRQTDAKLYKFNQGRYQTYFALGTNCVLLADDIVGSLGTDKFVMVGILTPGTYFDFMEKQYHKSNTWVSARRIYYLKENYLINNEKEMNKLLDSLDKKPLE